MNRIPIKAAKDIAQKYKQNQVAIVTFDKSTGLTHVVTYGKSVEECEQAAALGNIIKKQILKWPAEKCISRPKRSKWKWEPTYELLNEKGFISASEYHIPVWIVYTSPQEDSISGYAVISKANIGHYIDPYPFCPKQYTFNTTLNIEPNENNIRNDDGVCVSVFKCKSLA